MLWQLSLSRSLQQCNIEVCRYRARYFAFNEKTDGMYT